MFKFYNNGIQEGSKPASTTSSIPSLDELPEQLPTIVREDCVIHPKGQTSWWGARDQEKWVYVKELGRGGFGVVQLERETKTNALRAIKKISTYTSSKIDYKRELSILIALKDHRDLFVQFLGWYQEKGCISLAMEYVEHGDLRGYLEEFGQQSEGSAKEIGMQVLEGLVILHGRSICYRDLKPENILLSSLSPINIKLADFGISKTTADTRLITQIGTCNYLAPEVRGILPPKFLKADGEYENSVDLWSLGCLLHEVMTLKLPFMMVDSSRSCDSTITGVAKVEFDNKAFYDFCYGEADLPTGTLQTFNISERGIEFIKSVLDPNPRLRPSAANAMKSEWLLELPQLSNGIISGQQRSKSEILRTQMSHFGIGVSHRTTNTLLNDGGRSNSKTLLNELFPSLKNGISDILQRALKEGYSLFVLVLKQVLDIDHGLFDSIFYTALAAGDSGTIKTLSRIDYIIRSSYSRDVVYAIVKGGHIDMFKLLLEKGVGVNAKDDSGRRTLYAAAEGGHVDMVELLLEKGADINARDPAGRTALYAAAEDGHVDMAKLLLETGADVNARDPVDRTALYAAAGGGHVDMAKLLLEKGADVYAGNADGLSALYAAAEGGHVGMAKLLLEKGADVRARSRYDQRVFYAAALYAAAGGGHGDMVELLLEKRADVHARSPTDRTALYAASEGGHVDMAKLLLKTGARGRYSQTAFYAAALYAAAGGGHVDMAKLLLETGADVRARDPVDRTALHAAAEGGHVDMAKLLLEKGALVHAMGRYGETALHAAAGGGHVGMVKLLLEKGADVHAGYVLHVVVEGGHVHMAKLLLEKGADVNARGFNGRTPLYAAAEGGHVDMAKLLLQKGADAHARDFNARTPLYAAAEGGHVGMAKLLLKTGAKSRYDQTASYAAALHAAAAGGRVDMAKLLLEKGAHLRARDYAGRTALYAALEGGHVGMAKLLLETGADVRARDPAGLTALHAAAGGGHVDMAKLLLEKGALVHAMGRYGETALHAAAGGGHVGMVKLLLKTDARSRYDQTAFYAAALHPVAGGGHVDMAKLLLEKGADVHARNPAGLTALHAAAEGGHVDMAKLLLEKGADVHARSPYGQTALHAAAGGGHVDMAKLLLENGADINAKNYKSQTAFQEAVVYGHTKTIALLQNQ